MTFVTERTRFFTEHLDALRQVYFLKALPESALARIAVAGFVRRLEKDEILFQEKSRCVGLVVVLTGSIKVYKIDDRGRELTLDLELPGESVSELPLFDGGNYPANAAAAEDRATVLIVPRERFRAIAADYPEVAEQALKALGIRMRRLMQMLEAQTLLPVRSRLADYLLRTSQGRTTFPLEETNEAIAGHIGTVREVVSRTLRGLVTGGVIALERRSVTVRDVAALRQAAGAADSDAEKSDIS